MMDSARKRLRGSARGTPAPSPMKTRVNKSVEVSDGNWKTFWKDKAAKVLAPRKVDTVIAQPLLKYLQMVGLRRDGAVALGLTLPSTRESRKLTPEEVEEEEERNQAWALDAFGLLLPPLCEKEACALWPLLIEALGGILAAFRTRSPGVYRTLFFNLVDFLEDVEAVISVYSVSGAPENSFFPVKISASFRESPKDGAAAGGIVIEICSLSECFNMLGNGVQVVGDILAGQCGYVSDGLERVWLLAFSCLRIPADVCATGGLEVVMQLYGALGPPLAAHGQATVSSLIAMLERCKRSESVCDLLARAVDLVCTVDPSTGRYASLGNTLLTRWAALLDNDTPQSLQKSTCMLVKHTLLHRVDGGDWAQRAVTVCISHIATNYLRPSLVAVVRVAARLFPSPNENRLLATEDSDYLTAHRRKRAKTEGNNKEQTDEAPTHTGSSALADRLLGMAEGLVSDLRGPDTDQAFTGGDLQQVINRVNRLGGILALLSGCQTEHPTTVQARMELLSRQIAVAWLLLAKSILQPPINPCAEQFLGLVAQDIITLMPWLNAGNKDGTLLDGLVWLVAPPFVSGDTAGSGGIWRALCAGAAQTVSIYGNTGHVASEAEEAALTAAMATVTCSLKIDHAWHVCLQALCVLGVRDKAVCDILSRILHPVNDTVCMDAAVSALTCMPHYLLALRDRSRRVHMLSALLPACSELMAVMEPSVGMVMARMAGLLPCLLADTLAPRYGMVSPGQTAEPCSSLPALGCTVCDEGCEPPEEVFSTDDLETRTECLRPFFQLLTAKSLSAADSQQSDEASRDILSVRLQMMQSAKRIFTHIPLHHVLGPTQPSHPSGRTPHLTLADALLPVAAFMDLMKDPEEEIRQSFSQMVATFIGQPANSNPEEEDDQEQVGDVGALIVGSMRRTMDGAMQSGDSALEDSLLVTAGQLARVATGQLLVVTLLCMTESLTSPSLSVKATAIREIKETAATKGATAWQLFRPHLAPLCEQICLHSRDYLGALDTLVDVFGFSSKEAFLHEIIPTLLPRIVWGQHLDLLQHSAAILDTTLHDPVNAHDMVVGEGGGTAMLLLLTYASDWLAHLLLRCNGADDYQARRMFVNQQFDSNVNVDAAFTWEDVLVKLLTDPTHLDRDKFQLIRAMRRLAAQARRHASGWEETVCSNADLASFLRQHMLAVIYWANSRLKGGSLTKKQQHQLVEGFVWAMELLEGRHLVPIRARIMSVFSTALDQPHLVQVGLDGWSVFIRMLPLDTVGPMLSQVVCTLLPVLTIHPNRVLAILHYLIVENRDALRGHFLDLIGLPEVDELREIRSVLVGCWPKMDLRALLAALCKASNNESVAVRAMTLERLRMVLHTHQDGIYDLVNGKETVDSVVWEVVTCLLQNSRQVDQKVQLLCAECLGELAAIDPGRLMTVTARDTKANAKSAKGKTPVPTALSLSVDEPVTYAMNLVRDHLVPILLAGDSRYQDWTTYAIQEILKFCGFDKGLPVDKQGLQLTQSEEQYYAEDSYELWAKFPLSVREMIHPYLSSHYEFKGTISAPGPSPFFSVSGSFTNWVRDWAIDLIARLTTRRVRHVFRALYLVVKASMGVGLQAIPCMATNLLLFGSRADHNDMFAEIATVLDGAASHTGGSVPDHVQLACQVVFSLIDDLTRFLRDRNVNTGSDGSRKKKAPALRLGFEDKEEDGPVTEANLARVQEFLSRIPQLTLAKASFNCKAYTRALQHFETYLRGFKPTAEQIYGTRGDGSKRDKDKEERARQAVQVKEREYGVKMQDHMGLLQAIYAALDNPDAMAGVAAIRQHTSRGEEIQDHESAGRWSYALACYSLGLEQNPAHLPNHRGLVRCLMNLSHYDTALRHVEGAVAEHPNWSQPLSPYQIQAAWRLGAWDTLEKCLRVETEGSLEASVGRVLMAARQGDSQAFTLNLSKARLSLVGPLSAASMEAGSYGRSYPYIVQLHMLREVETTLSPLLTNQPGVGIDGHSISGDWDTRLKLTQGSFRVREQLLNMRRVLLDLVADAAQHRPGSLGELGRVAGQRKAEYWVKTAKLARKAGAYPTAYGALLHAKVQGPSGWHLEQAKLAWAQGDEHSAMIELQRTAENFTSGESKDVQAKTALLLGKLIHQTSHGNQNEVIAQYKKAVAARPEWEKGYFVLGQFYHRFLDAAGNSPSASHTKLRNECVQYVLRDLGKSLQYGNKYIFQSMPKLLTMWLEFTALQPGNTTRPSTNSSKSKGEDKTRGEKADELNAGHEEVVRKLNATMSELTATLPPYQFYTAFSQLLSRICHPHSETSDCIRAVILKVLVAYPSQATWLMLGVHRSTVAERARRCQDIFNKARGESTTLRQLVKELPELRDSLLDLCNKDIPQNVHAFSIDAELRNLKRKAPYQVMVPLQSVLTPTLPASLEQHMTHNPFPTDAPTIANFRDEVEVLHSLQRPRKITIVGSDGRDYVFLCKPKDDLRKDHRVMEFYAMINKLLKRDPDARHRQLAIRTYAVVVLNEECGMLEWVHHTDGLRQILNKIYRAKGLYSGAAAIKAPYRTLSKQQQLDKKVMVPIFKNDLLPLFPPVFHEWFLTQFGDPTSWYGAKLAYAYSLAVMSIVGYIIGLGDRHGENILFDSTTGECVHVDFNCLFNKGKTFEMPETVPFRLTHNMIDALGVTGYEGVFRKTCEVTLRVLRNETDSLMSVLKPFVYDPVADVGLQNTRGLKDRREIENTQALKVLKDVETRLRGKIGYNTLSIEGAVHQLIQEATDINLLACMYVGWAAYM